MGFLSRPFESSTAEIEKRLEDEYVPTFQTIMNMPPREAKESFRNLLKVAKENYRKGENSDLPENYGDLLLENESNDEHIAMVFGKCRKDGVTDEDIRWYWNRDELERQMMLQVDNLQRIAFYETQKRMGLSEEEAANKVRKSFPMYGNPYDTTHTSGDGRPLREYLQDRVNRYVEKRYQTDPDEFKKEIEQSSTFNALVRKEIKAGNL